MVTKLAMVGQPWGYMTVQFFMDYGLKWCKNVCEA